MAKPLTQSHPDVVLSSSVEQIHSADTDSLFERFAWIYIFCREHVFRDDTNRMIRALWPKHEPQANSCVLELGCGPGFYSRTLAERFPQIAVIGVDNSRRQLEHAQLKAKTRNVSNCRFQRGNVLNLEFPDESFSEVITSRLFTVLPHRERAVAEIFRVIRPGGRWFVAEPRFGFSASIPLFTMRILARLTGYSDEYQEPTSATTLSNGEFGRLLSIRPWSNIRTWRVGRYQYGVCQKP